MSTSDESAVQPTTASANASVRRTPHEEAERKRRLARVFGQILPEDARDERGDAWGDRAGDGDAWLRSQVPPHHG